MKRFIVNEQYRVARKADEERRAKVAARQESEMQRLRALADSMRHQSSKRARTASIASAVSSRSGLSLSLQK